MRFEMAYVTLWCNQPQSTILTFALVSINFEYFILVNTMAYVGLCEQGDDGLAQRAPQEASLIIPTQPHPVNPRYVPRVILKTCKHH